jgi:hypothetical protein
MTFDFFKGYMLPTSFCPIQYPTKYEIEELYSSSCGLADGSADEAEEADEVDEADEVSSFLAADG